MSYVDPRHADPTVAWIRAEPEGEEAIAPVSAALEAMVHASNSLHALPSEHEASPTAPLPQLPA